MKSIIQYLRSTTRLCAAVALLYTSAALAGPFEDAQAAAARKDYVRAAAIWSELAEKGDAEAQAQLGALYAMGKGVPQSYETAQRWFDSSARQGHAGAQFLLASGYAHGPTRNVEAARKWYETAADQDHPGAQMNLGLFILEMSPPVRDPVLAFKWLDLAATNEASPDVIQEFAARRRDELAKEMDSAQIAAAQTLVADWKAKYRQAE